MIKFVQVSVIGLLLLLSSCVLSSKSKENIAMDDRAVVSGAENGQSSTLYEVLPTDTLGAIAARFSTTPRNIIELNNFKKPYTIKPGQLINVPNNQEYIMDTPQDPIAIKISPKIK